jgi:hypothetical protein
MPQCWVTHLPRPACVMQRHCYCAHPCAAYPEHVAGWQEVVALQLGRHPGLRHEQVLLPSPAAGLHHAELHCPLLLPGRWCRHPSQTGLHVGQCLQVGQLVQTWHGCWVEPCHAGARETEVPEPTTKHPLLSEPFAVRTRREMQRCTSTASALNATCTHRANALHRPSSVREAIQTETNGPAELADPPVLLSPYPHLPLRCGAIAPSPYVRILGGLAKSEWNPNPVSLGCDQACWDLNAGNPSDPTGNPVVGKRSASTHQSFALVGQSLATYTAWKRGCTLHRGGARSTGVVPIAVL